MYLFVIARTPTKVGKIRLDSQASRTSPRPHEERNLGRSTRITDSHGQPIIIRYEDLENVKLLGRGQYGIVTKVLHKPTKMYLAAKVNMILNSL